MGGIRSSCTSGIPRPGPGTGPRFARLRIGEARFQCTPHPGARFKVPAAVRGLTAGVDLSDLDPFTVEEVGLWRSHLSPKGARYELVDRAPLPRGVNVGICLND